MRRVAICCVAMSIPPLPQPASVADLNHEESIHWYGNWEPLNPTTTAALMAGFDRPWWIIGGWSIEVFTGVPRPHEDMDISILSSDASAFREFLGEKWTPWNVDDGWFRPFDHRFPDIRPDSQLWLRRDGQSPWVLDIPLTPATNGQWTNKRCRTHVEDLDTVTWIAADGLRYARPEVTLMFKTAQARAKDRRDADVCLPLLDTPARTWLRETVAQFAPDHPWTRLE